MRCTLYVLGTQHKYVIGYIKSSKEPYYSALYDTQQAAKAACEMHVMTLPPAYGHSRCPACLDEHKYPSEKCILCLLKTR